MLVKNEELERNYSELKQQMQAKEATAMQTVGLARPQTAGGAFGRKKEDQMLDDEDLILNGNSMFDKELNELIARNQKIFNEAHSDMKEVSKRFGEATVNVRKVPAKQVLGTSRAVNTLENQENLNEDA